MHPQAGVLNVNAWPECVHVRFVYMHKSTTVALTNEAKCMQWFQ